VLVRAKSEEEAIEISRETPVRWFSFNEQTWSDPQELNPSTIDAYTDVVLINRASVSRRMLRMPLREVRRLESRTASVED